MTSETSKHTIKTTCAYCGVGCGVVAQIDQDTQTISVSGDPTHPANFGRLCSKGSALGDTLGTTKRIHSPSIAGQEVSWDTALHEVSNRLNHSIQQHGADSVMFYVSGQLLTEDYYVVNKLAKGFIGTNNIDSNSRLCMSSAVAGYKRAFGSDTVPNCYEDIEQAELFIICGSNMAWCHPVLFQRLKQAQQEDNKKVVVIDPRETDSCAIAQLHLAIKPGTDTTLFNGLFAYLVQHQVIDADYLQHCNNFDATYAACADVRKPADVARICDIPLEQLLCFYEWFAATEKVVTFYSMGVNQSSAGTDKVNSIINCHALTGRIGKPGAGPFSITGQPNAMGGREVGALANLLAAHFELSNSEHRQLVANFWDAPQAISAQPGVTAPDLAQAIEDGKIKAVWIMATNPVVSITQANRLATALKQCELVIVSDCSTQSDTLAYADIVLPAQGWGEKSGTVTNSERCISRQRRLLEPHAQAQADWWIVSQVAQRMGFNGFNYQHAQQIFNEHAQLSAYHNNAHNLRSFNIGALANLTPTQYENLQPTQWPITQTQQNTQRFFANGTVYTRDKKIQLVPISPRAPMASTSQQYPLVLNTGRIRDQWHTMTRTALAARLNQHLPEPFALIHPDTAAQYNIENETHIEISNDLGSIVVLARYAKGQRLGEIFCPMHWSDAFASNARVGQLIYKHLDPISAQPEFKFTPVAAKPVCMRWHGLIILHNTLDASVLLSSSKIHYWALNNQTHTQLYRLAGRDTTAYSMIQNWAHTLIPEPYEISQFIDQAQHSFRYAIFKNSQLQATIFIAPNKQQLPATHWLSSCFEQRLPELATQLNTSIALLKQWLLVGQPAEGDFDIGRIVCSCFSVGEKTIRNTIEQHNCTTAQEIGERTKAGTNCGSCVAELNIILKDHVS